MAYTIKSTGEIANPPQDDINFFSLCIGVSFSYKFNATRTKYKNRPLHRRPSTRRDLPPLLPRPAPPTHRPDGTRRHELRVPDVTLRNVTNPMNICSDFHLGRHFFGLVGGFFVTFSVTSHGKSEKDEKKLVLRLYIFAKSGNI